MAEKHQEATKTQILTTVYQKPRADNFCPFPYLRPTCAFPVAFPF